MADELIPIRLSHLLGHSGVGAIVRGPNGLVVVQDTRQWTDRQGMAAGKVLPYVERVRAALGISQQLRAPPVGKELTNGQVDGVCVPAIRFPSWSRCPSCGALFRWPWSRDRPDYAPRCERGDCKTRPVLEQVTWILVHPNGYLADVPWRYLTHSDAHGPAQEHCKVEDQLRLVERGYEERILRCDACKARVRFGGNERLPFGQGRVQPWTKDDLVPPPEGEEKDETAQVLTINDTRTYTPHAESALVIPPESRVRKGTVVDRLYRNSGDRARIDGARTPLARKGAIRTLATEYRCSTDDIETALNDLAHDYPLYGEHLTHGQLRESEFQAFLEILPDQRDDEDLVTRNNSDEWRELALTDNVDPHARDIVNAIRHLVRVDRLKAVKVFTGFTRLSAETETVVPPDIVGKSDWLPAVELYGEGIFIALDEERLGSWEQTSAVASRMEQILPRFVQSGRDSPNALTPRFLLLHTLSHLLMRQIESEGGYPAASLIERIYCANSPESMAGILVHVAVPDIAGSLGGLAELSEPRRFLGLMIRALDHSRWCSLDPVCSEHEGQGPALLNRAACHACALVPEPACEYGNTLLDRVFVKGDAASGVPSYFGVS